MRGWWMTSMMAGALAWGPMVGCTPSDGDDDTAADSEDGTTGGSDTAPASTSGADDTAGPATGSGGEQTTAATGDGPGSTGDTGPGGSTGPGADCQPTPTRMVVLGDSIPACAGVGGKDSDDCAPKRVNDWLDANVGPITYENLSVGGAVTTDIVNSQLGTIEVGMPGHALVMIYIGGNDLAPYIFASDQAALDGWNNTTGPEVAAAWETILDFLGDAGNFPDGVTLLMNTQYNPFDDCTAAPYFVSEVKTMLLHAHNDALTERANSREWAFITDQHPSYLGHGHYWNNASCPHYMEGSEAWMGDLIHPNGPGHHHLADEMIAVVEQEIYAGCD